MTDEEMIKAITEVDQRSHSNSHRIDKLERDNEALTRLATSVEVLATKQDSVAEKVDRIDDKVTALEKVPVEKWRNFVGYILAAVCSAGVTAIITLLIK